MCYDPTSRPPVPPISGGAGTGDQVVLTASDGAQFAAFSAVVDKPEGPGVVILPDVRGLHPFYEELAELFVQANVHATAIDYFGRTAGIGNRGEGFDHQPHIALTTPGTVALDTAAAVTHIRSSSGGGATSVFTVGFCFGGRESFNQAARGHRLDGVIGFYGRVAPRDPNDDDAPLRLVKRYGCPVLGLFGGADPSIPLQDVRAFGQALDSAGVRNKFLVYDGAPHSFFDRSSSQHKDACDDSWTHVLDFIHDTPQM